MGRIRTRLAEEHDRDSLIAFVRDYWSARHVFVDQPEVFDWQYAQRDGRINMILAEEVEDSGTARVLGVLGFIPMGRFDPALGDDDLLLALWKVRDDIAPPGLGLRLLKSVQSLLKPRLIGAIGISDMVGPIYRALGYTLDKLHHAALFDPELATFRIAQGVPGARPAFGPAGGYRLRPFLPADAGAIATLAGAQIPAKSTDYIRERYIDHPWYDYTLRVVERGNIPEALVVWRAVDAEGARLLRIVDMIGAPDWLACAGPLLTRELRAVGAEYIDLMQTGVDKDILDRGGWMSPDDYDGLILPNYFAPFEARNTQIALSWKMFGDSGDKPLRLFRADSDQDRPNQPMQYRSV
ncbi:hypothetical protein C8N32_10453 [Rhodovulum imhoffii]|uniref:Uncharacterized protein n=1 Tax=Rhodovulum imhoffii TaxID=365340 RepID=A0A2T5BU00_9RHOB|nr:hypothetical protein [Rhodovulum imhoffii]MBK5932736.1 hypothetical protein [Rhodovulum imhoffii]PTN02942.1 hypothetical protein C8N32_10453 [Rhodovulum imhoffii]